MRDILQVQLAAHRDPGVWTSVELLVNGRNLEHLVAEFERSKGYESPGGYAAIELDGLQAARDRLIGEPSLWPGDGETVLLTCAGCGEEGCWPLFGRIELRRDVVHWSRFRQPHRPDRDYSAFRFTFDRGQYDAALSRAFDSG